MMQAGRSGKPMRRFCRGRAAYKSGQENPWSIIDQFAYLIANNLRARFPGCRDMAVAY
jgi:hypothetical protein